MRQVERPHRDRRRRRRRLALGGAAVAAGVGLWGVLAARLVLSARSADLAGLGQLSALERSSGVASALKGGDGPKRLQAAAADFSLAASRLGSPLLEPVRLLPVAGRQLSSATHLSSAAAEISQSAYGAASRLPSQAKLLSVPSRRGTALGEIVKEMASVRQVASRADLGPRRGLIGPLAKERAVFSARRGELVSVLSRAVAAGEAVDSLASGSQRVLVIAASNAEMRNGAASFLAATQLSLQDGSVKGAAVVPTGALAAPAPVPGASAAELSRLWGFSHPATYFDSLGLDPSFPPNAAVASRIWAASRGSPRPTTVVYLDVAAVVDLLAATGPQQAGGVTLGSSNAAAYFLHGQYGGQPPGGSAAEARTNEVIGTVAQSILTQLASGRDAAGIVAALVKASAGRHFMIWSASPAIESRWAAAGISGQIGPSSMLLGLSNLGANKLDPFLHLSARLSTRPIAGGTEATVSVDVVNTARGGHPSLVEGPAAGLGLVAGQYLGLLQLSVPGSASALRVSPAPGGVVEGRQGRFSTIATQVSILPGSSQSFTFSFRLPPSTKSLYVLPSARMPANVWHYGKTSFSDATTSHISW